MKFRRVNFSFRGRANQLTPHRDCDFFAQRPTRWYVFRVLAVRPGPSVRFCRNLATSNLIYLDSPSTCRPSCRLRETLLSWLLPFFPESLIFSLLCRVRHIATPLDLWLLAVDETRASMFPRMVNPSDFIWNLSAVNFYGAANDLKTRTRSWLALRDFFPRLRSTSPRNAFSKRGRARGCARQATSMRRKKKFLIS